MGACVCFHSVLNLFRGLLSTKAMTVHATDGVRLTVDIRQSNAGAV